ncbi:histidine kinase [Dyadobacter sp. CY261]|uniref:sensor histidine kinase n=1 Tax=Dyadobacter sp. CY261 TaxID=2907203 RepID=UPI001F489D4E|nr:histidine kinase [Dyadobacter sp. CY261]MCF0074986.1 histidine kinase [Dyadobacter sp. CY261]
MILNRSNPRHEEKRAEIVFFLIYFILFPVISSFEYNFNERGSATLFIQDIPERVVYGSFSIISYGLYYELLIKRLLFRERLMAFAASLVVFLIALNFSYVLNYWLVARMSFLPADMVKDAATWSKADVVLHFSVVYIFRDLLVITALAYYLRAGRLTRQVDALRSQQLEVELNSLKFQLQPHFFFNTLNNIYSLALQGSVKTAPLVAGHAEIMRYILYDSALATVALSKEVAFLRSVTEVECIRLSQHISVKFETQGITDALVIEPLLLLPFVENAFKHGVRDEIAGGYVCILICCFDNDLIMEVKNSRSIATRTSTEQGVGLANVMKRLALLYPGTHRIEVTEARDCYEVRLNLKLKSE